MRFAPLLILILSSQAFADYIEMDPEQARKGTLAPAKEEEPKPEPAPTEARTAEPVRTAAAENAADGPTSVTASVERKGDKWLEPYGAIAGGMHLESLNQPPDVETQSQNPTVAVSRIGLRGGVGKYITFASAFEASLGGPLGYGASVWE